MFITILNRKVEQRLQLMLKHGADADAVASDWQEYTHEIERLARAGVNDFWLMVNWGAPFELGLLSKDDEAYRYVMHRGAPFELGLLSKDDEAYRYVMYPTPLRERPDRIASRLDVPDYVYQPILDRLEVLLTRIAAFSNTLEPDE